VLYATDVYGAVVTFQVGSWILVAIYLILASSFIYYVGKKSSTAERMISFMMGILCALIFFIIWIPALGAMPLAQMAIVILYSPVLSAVIYFDVVIKEAVRYCEEKLRQTPVER
jgi:hypothetical protein